MADGIIIKTTITGTASNPVEERIEVPVWCGVPAATHSADSTTTTPAMETLDTTFVENINPDESEFFRRDSTYEDLPGVGRTQGHYIQQFVDRVHPLLKSLLAREDLPRNTLCERCTVGNIAVWRCRDCTAARILCRGCIRDCHMDCPTHRIEVWTGHYFRRAELWEVGLYILVRHHSAPHMCRQLKFQSEMLGGFQIKKDLKEQENLAGANFNAGDDHRGDRENSLRTDAHEGENHLSMEGEIPDDDEDFATFVQRLDDMYKRRHGGVENEGLDKNLIFEDEDEDNGNDVEDVPDLPGEYIPMPTCDAADTTGSTFNNPSTNVPQVDALNNPYVRVIHTNGVHHIGLVFCTCRGRETTHGDLMAAGLVPTSFTRYKTVFTHAVLNDFRLSNLECKASAYQYFQKLRRQTSPMSPDSVPNLYHELRRMSRLWRWMKKLKWAGMAHRTDFTIDPKPGELANFCPACPQPGINLSENWQSDSERYMTKFLRKNG